MTKEWTISDISTPLDYGTIEFKDEKGEYHNFELIFTENKIVFGGVCNTGFLESGFMEWDRDCETRDGATQELVSDLETYYNDGPQYVSRIVFNKRM